MGGILEGVRVLDFGRYIAGPYCATLLAEFGAEVIRVENRDGSEDRFVAPVGEGGEGALFLQINRNKKCITLDPMKPEGQQVMRRLVATSDVVVANLPPQTLRAMKLDYESLRRHHTDDGNCIRRTGPVVRPRRFRWGRASHVGFGLYDRRWRSALPGRGELGRFRNRVVLRVRNTRRSDRARKIRERADCRGRVACNRIVFHQRNVDRAGRDQHQSRSDRQSRPDRCAGGHLPHQGRLGTVTGHPLFIRWARLMGDEDQWLNDPRFADDIKRGDNGPVISERMARWCAERTTQEAVDTLGKAMVPAGPVLSPQQVLNHPHIRAAGFMQDVDYPGLPKPAPVVRAAIRLSETPGEIATRPPMLGEHTDLVLAELGYDTTAIATLRRAGIIGG